jgi:hypothetical protein
MSFNLRLKSYFVINNQIEQDFKLNVIANTKDKQYVVDLIQDEKTVHCFSKASKI